MPQPNILAILLGALVPMFVGFIYYHTAVMGKPWMKSLGMTMEDTKKANMPLMLGVSLLMSLLMSFYLLANVDGPGQEGPFDSFKHGAFHGFLLALMIAMPVLVTNGLFEMKNFKNMAINALYWLIAITLMGGVIDALNHWPNEFPVQ